MPRGRPSARAGGEPGGAEGAGAGVAGGRATGGLREIAAGRGALADIAKSGRGLVEDLKGLGGNLPKIEPPGGRPVGLPPGKPLETPVAPTTRPPRLRP